MSLLSQKNPASIPSVSRDSGAMAERVRHLDWTVTPLGAMDNWSQALRTALGLLLHARFPMMLFWGPQSICFYNDAHLPNLKKAGKHPSALGAPAQVVWPEIWLSIKPYLEQVLAGQEAVWTEDQLISTSNNAAMLEEFQTCDYSAVCNESGIPEGVFITCLKNTHGAAQLQTLQNHAEALRLAVDTAELATCDLDLLTNTLSANERFEAWFGLETSVVTHLSDVLEITAAEDRDRVSKAYEEALDPLQKAPYDLEYTIRPSNKPERIVRARGRVLFNESQLAHRFHASLQDITSEVRSRQAAAERGRHLDNILSQVNAGIVQADLTGRIIEVNKMYCELLGYSREELLTKTVADITHPEDRMPTQQRFELCVREGKNFFIEKRYIRKDGAIVWVNNSVTRVTNNQGGFFVTAVSIDITDTVMAGTIIKNSEEQLRISIESGDLGTYDFFPQTGKIIMSERNKKLFGLPPHQEPSYENFLHAVHPEDRARTEVLIAQAMQPGTGVYENEHRTQVVQEGLPLWVRSKGKVDFDSQGKAVRFTGVTQDITKQKEILRSLQLQSLVLEKMNEGVSVSDETGIKLLTNPAEDTMFGYAPGELI